VNLGLSAKHFGAPAVWVYDLGVSADGAALIVRECGLTLVKDPSGHAWYPSTWTSRVKDFAWKALVITDAVARAEGVPILYMDAGSEVRAPLTDIFRITCTEGHAFFKGQDNSARRWVHDTAAACLGAPDKDALLAGKTSYHAGTVAIRDARAPAFRDVVLAWYNASFVRDCIAPPGSTLRNHRQDQAAMTVLAYARGYDRHHTRLMAPSAQSPRISKDALKPSNATIIVSRGRSMVYITTLYDSLCVSKHSPPRRQSGRRRLSLFDEARGAATPATSDPRGAFGYLS